MKNALFMFLGAALFVLFSVVSFVEMLIMAIVTFPIALFLSLKGEGSFLENHQNLANKCGEKSGMLKAKLLK